MSVPGLRPLVFAALLAGCAEQRPDPMPAARESLARELRDGRIEEDGTVVTFSPERIAVDGAEPSLLCPAISLFLGAIVAWAMANELRGGLVTSAGQVVAVGAYLGAPIALAGVFSAWWVSSADLDVDLVGRTVTHTKRWRVGYERVTSTGLDPLACSVNEVEDEDGNVTGCTVTLTDPRAWFGGHWPLLPQTDCTRARALCEHVSATVRQTMPLEAP